MSSLKVPVNLPDLVKTAFGRAKANGELNYYATQFQLRYSPALAHKPTAPRPKPSSPGKAFDPFEAPENGPLFITDIPPAHNLVLNKFAVVPEHFILATKQFEEQTHLLEEDDLAATYACIQAYQDYHGVNGDSKSEELFAFFNSGEHSGASQPHRHVQLLPVERIRDGLKEGDNWGVLADRLVPGETEKGSEGISEALDLPFATFAKRIGPEITPRELHDAYLALYRQAVAAVKNYFGTAGGQSAATSAKGKESEISYNMAMTRSVLVICPRLAEGSTLAGHDGQILGKLSLNGTVLAGTALVKSEAEWNAVKEDSGGEARALAEVLGKIGVPLGAAADGRGRL